MRRFADLSLRSKLVLVMTATSSLALTIAFLGFFLAVRLSTRVETVRQISSLAEIVGANSTAALMFDDPKAGEEILATLRIHSGVVAARLFTATGATFATFATYRRLADSPLPLPDRPELDGSLFVGGRLHVFRRVAFQQETIGAVFLAADLEEVNARQARFALLLLVLVLVSGTGTALAAGRIQNLVSRPIVRLASAAKSVADSKDYSVRVAGVGKDEVGDMTRAFNHMMAEIQARDGALHTAQEALRRHVGELEQEIREKVLAQEALRQSEEYLRQAQKMEAVGTLAGGVAHDFNNLLQAMLGHVQFLRRQPHDHSLVVERAQELHEEITRGAALTRQLLLFSRRETTSRERLDLNEVMRDATRMLRRLVRANIAFSIELTDRPLPVIADRGQLQQVLVNLTMNAADAMPEGGKLLIRTGAGDDGDVRLSVEDTGVGIPKTIRERIFEPFFTTKGMGRGTGLGLSVVHGIVEQHGGRVEVESAVGTGTVFRVVLPMADPGAHEAVEESAIPGLAPGLGRGERILVVEDEDGAREGLLEILLGFGYEVVAVSSGEEAGLLPSEDPFDLLLTDVMLPGALGPALADGLRDRWPALRVVLMSGYAEDEAVRRGVSSGTTRFLQKPFDMETLAHAVRSALDEPADPACG